VKSHTPSVCSVEEPVWTSRKRRNWGPSSWRPASNAQSLLMVKFDSEPTMVPIQVAQT